MFTYDYTSQFSNSSMAHTLDAEEVCANHQHQVGEFTRLHEDGWLITGTICEDYYYWVNDFFAVHKLYGVVRGNFESVVVASSKEAFDHFVQHHPANVWDYYDI